MYKYKYMLSENENTVTNKDSVEECSYDSSTYEINTWDDLEISTDLLRGIYAYGFEAPSKKKLLNR